MTSPERMTAAEYRARVKEKPAKYRNKALVVDGVRFDSRREFARWAELQAMERRGEISDLRRQPVFVLAASVKFAGSKRAKPALRYVADFFYHEGTARVVEDIKSPATAKNAAFVIKRHLMLALYGLDVRVTT